MSNPEKRNNNELPPEAYLAAGTGLGFMSGLPAALLVSETLNTTDLSETMATTTETQQWPGDHVDPVALSASLPVGMIIGGVMGWQAMRARQRGETFTGLRRR